MKKIKDLWQEIKERWKSNTPIFWKKIRKYAIVVGSSAVSVIGVDKLFDLQSTYNIPSIIFTVAGYIIVASAAVGLSAQITKDDKPTNNDN